MERDMKLLKAEKRELSDELENLKKSQRMETNEAQKQRQNQQDRNLSDQTRTHSQEIAVLKQQIANLEWKLGNSKMERSQNDVSEQVFVIRCYTKFLQKIPFFFMKTKYTKEHAPRINVSS